MAHSDVVAADLKDLKAVVEVLVTQLSSQVVELAALALRVTALEEIVQPLDLGDLDEGAGQSASPGALATRFDLEDTPEVETAGGTLGAFRDVHADEEELPPPSDKPVVNPLSLGRAGFDSVINNLDT